MDGKPAPLDDPRSFMEWLVQKAGSQAELSRLSGILSSTVSDYVRGVNEPGLVNVLKMMRGVGARLDGAPLQEEARLQEAHAAEVDRLRRLNDQIEEELERPRRVRTPRG